MHPIVDETRPVTTGVAAWHRTSATPVESRLRERIDVFEEAVRRTAAAEDSEAIHDLRVASRRLVAFLRAWRALVPSGCFRRIARDVRATRRDAGRARDVEVQVEMLRERLAREPAPDDDALDLLRELEARLQRRRRRAGKRARAPRSRRLLARLSDAAKSMDDNLLSHLEAFEAAHARERGRREEAIGLVRTSLETHDDAELHRARIALKKWRYALESLGGIGGRAEATLGALRPLQDVLGGVLDGAALRAVLAERMGEPGRDGPARTLGSIVAELDAERSTLLDRFRELGGKFLSSVEVIP
jgi:CHAD domain-containing protein